MVVGYHYYIIPQLGSASAPCNSGSTYHFPQPRSVPTDVHAPWEEGSSSPLGYGDFAGPGKIPTNKTHIPSQSYKLETNNRTCLPEAMRTKREKEQKCAGNVLALTYHIGQI